MKKIYKVNNIFSEAFLGGGRSFRLTERRSGSRISLTYPLLTMLFMLVWGGWSSEAWGTDCTYTQSFTNVPKTANGKWNNYKGFGTFTVCNTNSSLYIVSVSMNVAMDGSGWDKGFKGNLKASDGTVLKSNFEVGCGSNANCSANVNKSGISSISFETSNTYSKSRTVTITSITVTYRYAPSLSAENVTMENTPVSGSSPKKITVSYQNASYNSTLSVTETADANGFFSISPASYTLTNCSGSKDFTVTFAPTSSATNATATYKFSGNGAEKSVTVTGTSFDVVDPTFTNTIAASYYVDDTALDLADLWRSNNKNGEITYSKLSFTPDIANETGATVPSISNDNKLSLGQAGTVIIQMHQAASTGYNEKTVKDTIRIKKRTPAVSWSSQTYYFNKNYSNVYSITAGEASLFSIGSSDEDVATADGTSLTTYYKPASTTLTLTAVENYKWAGKVFTKSIKPKDVPNHVPFTITSSNHSGFEGPKSNDVSWESNGYMLGDNGWTTQDDNFVIKFNGVPDKLTFDRHLDKWGLNLPETYLCQVFESEDGTNWSVNAVKVINEQTQDVYSGEVQLLPTTRYLKFTYHGTVYCHFNNIKVTELNDFYTNPTSIDFGTNNKIGIPRANETFKFHYANVGYKVNLSTNDSHFTVSPTSITTIGGEKAGYVAITVGYSTEEVHTSNNAKVTITDELGHSTTVDLIGATERKTQTIHWTEGYTTDEPSVVIGKTYIGVAEASTGYTIKYESSDEDVIEILDGGTSFRPKAEGTAEITAKQEGDENWLPISISKNFKTTNKTIQVIAWDQNLTRLRTTTASVPLTAQVKLQNSETGDLTYSKVRTDMLVYTSSNPAVVSVSGHTLNIVGAGNATLTASVVGDDTYESATTSTPVVVKVPSTDCDDKLIGTDLTEEYEFFHVSLTSSMTKIVTINNSDQYPGSMTFQHHGVKWGKTILGGTIAVYESSNNSDWTYLGTVTPTTNTQTSPSYPLSRNAKYLKFFRESSATGYHYIGNIEITPAQYIESSAAEVGFGEITVNSQDNRQITINYGNAKGELAILVPEGSGLSVDPASIDVDCGTTGSTELTIYYNPTSVVPLDENITISDAKSGKSLVVPVTATVSRATQSITWNPTATTLYTVDALSLNATAGSGNTVIYEVKTSSPANAISISGSVASINTPGVVTITASEPGDAIWEEAPSKDKEFTIQITPLHVETAPTLSANSLTYGQTLSTLTITNQGEVRDIRGNVVTGTWAWQTSALVLHAGDCTPTLVFTPSEHTAWYSELTTNVNVTVNKVDPVATVSNVGITYGATASSVTLSGTGDGEWSWDDSRATQTLAAGVYDDMAVKFTPTDGVNYNELSTTITLTVGKADPEVTVNAVEINYGTLASSVTLSGTGVAGTWSWTDTRKDQVLAVGEYTMNVHFKPTDLTNYNEKDATVALTVKKADPVAAANAVEITYGTLASSVDLEGTGVAGTWSWTDTRKDQVLAVGEYTMNVHFIPNDATNYNEKDAAVALTVKKADPVAAANAVEITYGTLASSVDLEGTGVAGTWSWTDTRKDQVLAAGSYTMNVHFIPNDATNYNEKDATVALTVKKADPVAAANAVEITYGAKASSVDLEGTGVAGTWSWTDTRKDDILAAGSYTMNVHFAPTDDANYNEKDATVALTVKKATPTLNWTSAPTELAYNATDAVYTATSASDGDITYSIISGDSYARIDANTGALTIDVPGNTITIQAEQAEGTNYSAPTTITVEVTIAAAPVGPNTFTNNAGDGDWQNAENWTNGVPSGVNPDVIISGALEIDENVTVGNLTIENTGSIAVITGGTLTVKGTSEDRSEYGDVHVLNDGAIHLGSSADLQVRDFTLDAKLGDADNAAASGQVDSVSNLHVNGDAYFKMSFDVTGQITYGWYDFVVPFEVDALNGVFAENGTPVIYGTDYIIMSHSEEMRARNQKAWNTFTGTLEPGRIYTITFEETKIWNTFLFKKKAGSELANSGTYTSDYSSAIGETQDRGWNGFGNGTLQHRELTDLSGISKVQMYNHTWNRYDVIDDADWNTKALAVGTAFSIQVGSVQPVVLVEADAEKPLRAPRMDARMVDEFCLTLTVESADRYADRLWVSASEEATGEYVIGRDLLKMGTPTSAKVAQMWTFNNGLNLCDIEMPLVGNNASTPLNLYAPQAGTYEIAVEKSPEDATLYLTQNGDIVWNLSMSPYTIDLTKGTTSGYGLRIVADRQTTTDVENSEIENQSVRKVLIDDKIYIVTPDGKMYDIVGKSVKY